MKHRVLVVDQSSVARLQVADALEGAGFEVAQCAGDQDAARSMKTRPFDLAVVGETLSDGDRSGLARRLRAPGGADTPTVLLTAGGDIEVRIRAIDDGATDVVQRRSHFSYLIKTVRQLLTPPIAGLATTAPAAGPFRVVVVDDSPTYIHVIGDELGQWGHDIVGALSGQDALRYLNVQRADCVVLDVFMPGLSGVDTCRMLRANPKLADIPVVMLTGHEDSVAKLAGQRMSADAYLVKAAGFKTLDARISELLLRRHALGKVRHVTATLTSITRDAAHADEHNQSALRIRQNQRKAGAHDGNAARTRK